MFDAPFTCNVCEADNIFRPEGDWREAPTCRGCGSSVRVRQVVHCLTLGLLGQSLSLPSIEESGRRGYGLSDPDLLASALAGHFGYTNTYYHQAPQLDVCRPDDRWASSAEFLISSDVFEHVARPVQAAFDGAAHVLADGGLLVLTVPFDNRSETTEHFPQLNHHRLAEINGAWVLIDCTREGNIEIYRDLNFHGGPGSTLEMRFFSRSAVVAHLEAAGFEDIQIHAAPVPQWGIFPPHDQGLPITARKRMARSVKKKAWSSDIFSAFRRTRLKR